MLKIGSLYTTTRHGSTTTVELVEVKNDNVLLRYPGRKDSFRIPLNRFKEYYVPK